MIEWLGIAYSAIKDILKYRQNKKGLNPEETVKLRQKWKNQIKKILNGLTIKLVMVK